MQAITVLNGSITLPPEVLLSLDVKEGDEIFIECQHKTLIISTQNLEKPTLEKTRKKIASIAGIAKGVFHSADDIDNFMNKERNSWS